MNDFVKLSICVDCVMKLANDEDPIEPTEYPPLSAIPDNAQVMLGGDKEGFSWTPCEGCGNPLGGDRFTAYMDDSDN